MWACADILMLFQHLQMLQMQGNNLTGPPYTVTVLPVHALSYPASKSVHQSELVRVTEGQYWLK